MQLLRFCIVFIFIPNKFTDLKHLIVVDKNLLDIPEDEFNPREVSLRDLILLAEHREKQMVCAVCIEFWFIDTLKLATTKGCKIFLEQYKSKFSLSDTIISF